MCAECFIGCIESAVEYFNRYVRSPYFWSYQASLTAVVLSRSYAYIEIGE